MGMTARERIAMDDRITAVFIILTILLLMFVGC